MFINYLKLSFRLLARNPFFTFINVAGLSVGFAVSLILWQFSQQELKSDRQWQDWERIARIGLLWEWSDDDKGWDSEKYGVAGPPIAVQLKEDFPEIESFTRILPQPHFTNELAELSKDIVVSYETPGQTELKILEEKVVMADVNLFNFFSIPLQKGNASSVLQEVNSVVISNTIAQKYFGDDDALGKLITINKRPHIVTGVFDDLPHNTHLDFQIVLSNKGKVDYWATAFGRPCVSTYIKTNVSPDWTTFSDKLNKPERIEEYYGPALRFFKSKAKTLVQPLDEIAYSQKWRGDQFNPKSEVLLRIFQTVGILVLVLAFINYISLTSSRFKRRQTEIGTRKVSGAGSLDFVKQFMIESGLIFIIALALAFTLLQLLKTPLYIVLQIPLLKPDLRSLLLLLSVVAVMIILSAVYPAYLSQTPKIRDLFSKVNQLRANLGFQWSLTSIQLSIAIILIVWAFMIYNQVNYVLSKDLGFSKANQITIHAPVLKTNQYETDANAFKNKLGSIAGVQHVTTSNTVMGDNVSGIGVRRNANSKLIALDSNGGIDENFIPFFDITILTGRNFIDSDRGNGIIISEGALPRLGFTSAEEAVGSTLEVETQGNGWEIVTIVGVIKSYRLRPMLKFSGDHDLKADAGIGLLYKDYLIANLKPDRFTLNVDAAKISATISEVEQAYSEIFPGNVFLWHFLDEHINRHYKSEKIWRNQILFFTCIAIGIACLGMLGMIANKAVEKTKEIGIRKVLGAGLSEIAQLLLSTTAIQIFFATLIGIPAAYFLTEQYLENFSERIDLHWWHFVVPVGILAVIMFATVASVLWKAGRSNPVEALKHE